MLYVPYHEYYLDFALARFFHFEAISCRAAADSFVYSCIQIDFSRFIKRITLLKFSSATRDIYSRINRRYPAGEVAQIAASTRFAPFE